MDVSMNTLASQEMTLNKAQAQDAVHQKTLEKSEEARSNNQSVERPETARINQSEGRTIDTYA